MSQTCQECGAEFRVSFYGSETGSEKCNRARLHHGLTAIASGASG